MESAPCSGVSQKILGTGRVRIGLLRHFPVDQKFPTGWRTASELQEWLLRYDRAPVIVGPFDLGGVTWRQCLASDLPRAQTTARAVFSGEIEFTPCLRETQFAPFRTGRLRMPVFVWHGLVRYCWLTGHVSQRRVRDEFCGRVVTMADRLMRLEQDTLVVSHAGMMAFLSAELRRRGYQGPKLRVARHARAYLYERFAR
jgi:broad specificity phosphatase PhoE